MVTVEITYGKGGSTYYQVRGCKAKGGFEGQWWQNELLGIKSLNYVVSSADFFPSPPLLKSSAY